jgi:hypothetical protein
MSFAASGEGRPRGATQELITEIVENLRKRLGTQLGGDSK